MIKPEDFITTQRWMLDLGLTDKQEKIYALIWGYSRDGHGVWRGTAAELAEWAGCTVRNAQKIVRQLEDRGLIAHDVISWSNGQVGGSRSEFWAVLPDKAEAPEKGGKTKIRWRGLRTQGRKGGYELRDVGGYEPRDVTHKDSSSNIDSTSIQIFPTNPPIAPQGAVDSPKRFTPPSVEQVSAYCLERNNGIDPNAFIDHYISNGWKVGKAPMKDWKAAVRTWEQRRSQNQPYQTTQRPAPQPRPAKRVVEISDEEFASLFR